VGSQNCVAVVRCSVKNCAMLAYSAIQRNLNVFVSVDLCNDYVEIFFFDPRLLWKVCGSIWERSRLDLWSAGAWTVVYRLASVNIYIVLKLAMLSPDGGLYQSLASVSFKIGGVWVREYSNMRVLNDYHEQIYSDVNNGQLLTAADVFQTMIGITRYDSN